MSHPGKNILLIDTIHPVFSSLTGESGFAVTDGSSWTKEEILGKLSSYNGIVIRSRFRLDKEFLDHAGHLVFIARAGAGMENIDVNHAQAAGIACLHAPEGNRDAVGEHAVGMLLSLFNHLNRADAEVRQGKWRREENRGLELKGKVIGVIGFGNMGTSFVQKLAGFETRVLIHDKYKAVQTGTYYRAATMEEIYREADVVSLHVPLTDETRYLLNEESLGRFRRDIFVVNTARGKNVDTAALVNGLKSGKVRGAALDVLEYESLSFENLDAASLPEPFQYLVKSEQVILSPHIAGWTLESNERIATVLANKISALFDIKKHP